MKVVKIREREEIRRMRETRYLETWPVHRQLEATMDRDRGDSRKWDRMQEDFMRIRQELPYPND